VGAGERARRLVSGYIDRLEAAARRTARQSRRPRVYFEEWNEPLISGIQWVSELVELAGGRNVFADRAGGSLARERYVTHEEILEADPEIICASWCGEPVDFEELRSREGYESISAVRSGALHELDSSIILQPGPAALTDGLDALEAIIRPHAQ
jgi:iron complex transport system substrate-binding protein